jgi:hypothetical protein
MTAYDSTWIGLILSLYLAEIDNSEHLYYP